MFGAIGPVGVLIPNPVVPHVFHINGEYRVYPANFTLVNECKCFSPNSSYQLVIYYTATIWLNTTGEINAGQTVNFGITIGAVEGYLPQYQKVLSSNTLTFPAYEVNAVWLTNSVFAGNATYAVLKLNSVPSVDVAGYPTPGWNASGVISFQQAGETNLRLDIPYQARSSFSTTVNSSDPYHPTEEPITVVQPQSTTYSSDVLNLREWLSIGGGIPALVTFVLIIIRKEEDEGHEPEGDSPKTKHRKHDTPSDKRRAKRRADARKKDKEQTKGKTEEANKPKVAPFEPPLDYQVRALNQVLGDWLDSTHKRAITMTELAKVLPLMNRDGINPLFEPLTLKSVAEGIEELRRRGTIKEIRDGTILF